MAVSGFEGFEKRLELTFSGDDPNNSLGLRRLDFESLDRILRAVQCTVVSAVANRYFDAYVLSESSLFVYPTKIVIKTCGTTQLLKSVRPFILHAAVLGLAIRGCRYTRGSFIFPDSQPFPHTSFRDEIIFLEDSLPGQLSNRKASVMPSNLPSHSWHVFTATDNNNNSGFISGDDANYTVEVCMNEINPIMSAKFFRGGDHESNDAAGKEMTAAAGIGGINAKALICDIAFDPCGYSMNGVDGDRYSTIHVTPEDGFSYASFESVGSIYDGGGDDLGEVVRRAVQIFRPATVTVSTAGAGGEVCTMRVASALKRIGLRCRSCTVDSFPGAGTISFQMFTDSRK